MQLTAETHSKNLVFMLQQLLKVFQLAYESHFWEEKINNNFKMLVQCWSGQTWKGNRDAEEGILVCTFGPFKESMYRNFKQQNVARERAFYSNQTLIWGSSCNAPNLFLDERPTWSECLAWCNADEYWWDKQKIQQLLATQPYKGGTVWKHEKNRPHSSSPGVHHITTCIGTEYPNFSLYMEKQKH